MPRSKQRPSHIKPEPTVPPFDPDPELVADLENNRFAVRAFRKAAQQAHEDAERKRQASSDA